MNPYDYNYKEFITLILNDKEKLDKISKRSYYHVNHFYKIVLHEDNDYIYRLHIWKCLDFEQNPHSHGWDFESKIIKGKFIHSKFNETKQEEFCSLNKKILSYDNGIIYDKYNILLNISNGSSNIELIGNVMLTENYKEELNEGEKYNVTSKEIHKFIPCENNSITIIKESKLKDSTASIYSMSTIKKEERRPNITREELIYLLNSII